MIFTFRTSQMFQFLACPPLFKPELQNFYSADAELALQTFPFLMVLARQKWNMVGVKESRTTRLREKNEKGKKISRIIKQEQNLNPVFIRK